MLDSEVTWSEMTWFKASLLTMVYTIVLSSMFVGLARMQNGLGLAMVVLTTSILGTLLGAAIRPRPELKLWLMLAAVSLVLTAGIILALSASDI